MSAIPDLAKILDFKPERAPGTKDMIRFIVWLAVAACLVLTTYFGTAAWRASDDSRMDITGRIGPAAK